jgi:two-component system CheB/CheR fusion protein
LLVEDHVDTSFALASVLELEGYRVRRAHSVAEALAVAADADGSLDVLICDLGLPDGNGVELMRELRARAPLQGIALTGYGRPRDVARTLAAGFERHLTKPVDLPELVAAIESLRAKRA